MVGKAIWLPDQVTFILRLKEQNPRMSLDQIAVECTRTGRWPRKGFNKAGIRYVLGNYEFAQGDSTTGSSNTSVTRRISTNAPTVPFPQQQAMQQQAYINPLTPQEVARQQHAAGQTSTLNSGNVKNIEAVAGRQIFATMQTPQPSTSSEYMSMNSDNNLQFSHNHPSTEFQTSMQNNAQTSPLGINNTMNLPYHPSGHQRTESSQSSSSGGSAKRGYTSDNDGSPTLKAKSVAQFKPTKIARSNSKYTGFATKNKEQKARPRAESTSKLSRPISHMSPPGVNRVRSESVASMPPPPVPRRLSQGLASSNPQMYQAQGAGYRPGMDLDTNFGNFSVPHGAPQMYGPGMNPNNNTQFNMGNLPNSNASQLTTIQGRPQMNPQMAMNNSFNAYGSPQTSSHPNITLQGNSDNFSNPNALQQIERSTHNLSTGSEVGNATQQQSGMNASNARNPSQPSNQVNLNFLRRFGSQTLQGSQAQHSQVSQTQQQQAQWTPVPQDYVIRNQSETSAAGQGQGSSPALQSSSAAAPVNFFSRRPSWSSSTPAALQGAFGGDTRQETTSTAPGNNAGGQAYVSGNLVGQYQQSPTRAGASSYAQYSEQNSSRENPSLSSIDVGGPQRTHPDFAGQLAHVAREETDLRHVSPQSAVYSNVGDAQESVSTTVKKISSNRQDSNNSFVGQYQLYQSPQNSANSPGDARDAIKISRGENDSSKGVGQVNDTNINRQQPNQAQVHLIPENTYPPQDTSLSASRLPLQVEQAALARPLSALNTQVPLTYSTRTTATSASISQNSPSSTHIKYLQQVNSPPLQTASSVDLNATMNSAGRRDLPPVNYAEDSSSSASSSDLPPSPSVQQAARRTQPLRSSARLSARGSSKPPRGASTPRRRGVQRRSSNRAINRDNDVITVDEENAEHAGSSQRAQGSSQIAMDEPAPTRASQATYSDHNEESDEILPNINQGRVPQPESWSPYDAQAPVANFGHGQSFSSVIASYGQASSSTRPEVPAQGSSAPETSYHDPAQAYSFPGQSEQVDDLNADEVINADATHDFSAIENLVSQEEYDRIADEMFADPNFGLLEPEDDDFGPGEPVAYDLNHDLQNDNLGPGEPAAYDPFNDSFNVPTILTPHEYEGIFDDVDVSKIHQHDILSDEFGEFLKKEAYPAPVDQAEYGDFGIDEPEFPDLGLGPYRRFGIPSYNSQQDIFELNNNQAGAGLAAVFSNNNGNQQGASLQSNVQVVQAPTPAPALEIDDGIQFDAGGDLYGADDDDLPAIRTGTASNNTFTRDNTANPQVTGEGNAENLTAEADAAEGTAAAASTANDTASQDFDSFWADADIWERHPNGELVIVNTTSAFANFTPSYSRAGDSLVRPTAYNIHGEFVPHDLDPVRNSIPESGSISSRQISLDEYNAKMRGHHIIQLSKLMPNGIGGFGTHENIIALPKNAFKRSLKYLPKDLDEREEWHENIIESSKVATSSNSKDNEAMGEGEAWFEKLYFTSPSNATANAEAKKEEEERVAFQKKLAALPLEYRNSDRAYFLASTQNVGGDMFGVNPFLKHRMPPAPPVSEEVRKREIAALHFKRTGMHMPGTPEEERRARVAEFCKDNGKRVMPGDVVDVDFGLGLTPALRKVGIAERRRLKEHANAAAGKISINIPNMRNKIDIASLDPRSIAASTAAMSSKAKGKQKEGVSGVASQQQEAMSYEPATSGVLTPMDIEEQLSLAAAQGISIGEVIANSVDLSPAPATQSTDELMTGLFSDENASASVGSPDLLADVTARHVPDAEDGSWDDSILDFFLKPYGEL